MEKSKNCGCNHLKGIRCDVKNCVHHDGDYFCCADQISVGPESATNSTETTCITFKEKKDEYSF